MIVLYLQFKLQTTNNFNFSTIKLKLYKFIINLQTNNLMKFPVNCKPMILEFCNSFFSDTQETTQFLQFINDKLFISITEHKQYLIFKNILVNPKTKKELIDALIDSSKLPILVTTFNDNYKRFDGSFTNNQPLLPNFEKLQYKKTIKINCLFNYNCDISPSKFINFLYIMKKPSITIMNQIIQLGFNDCKQKLNEK